MGTGCTSEYKEAHRYQMPSQAPHTVAPTASTQKQTVTTTHPTSQTMNPVSQYVPAMYPSINQHYSGVVQAPKMSTLPPIVGSYPNPVVVQPRVVQNQVEQVDLVKARLKSTRDRVNNLIARQEADLAAVDRELMQEKANGLRNKPKVKYLLKQRKDYLVGLDDLRTRQQVVMKTVSDLERQHLDKSVSIVRCRLWKCSNSPTSTCSKCRRNSNGKIGGKCCWSPKIDRTFSRVSECRRIQR